MEFGTVSMIPRRRNEMCHGTGRMELSIKQLHRAQENLPNGNLIIFSRCFSWYIDPNDSVNIVVYPRIVCCAAVITVKCRPKRGMSENS